MEGRVCTHQARSLQQWEDVVGKLQAIPASATVVLCTHVSDGLVVEMLLQKAVFVVDVSNPLVGGPFATFLNTARCTFCVRDITTVQILERFLGTYPSKIWCNTIGAPFADIPLPLISPQGVLAHADKQDTLAICTLAHKIQNTIHTRIEWVKQESQHAVAYGKEMDGKGLLPMQELQKRDKGYQRTTQVVERVNAMKKCVSRRMAALRLHRCAALNHELQHRYVHMLGAISVSLRCVPTVDVLCRRIAEDYRELPWRCEHVYRHLAGTPESKALQSAVLDNVCAPHTMELANGRNHSHPDNACSPLPSSEGSERRWILMEREEGSMYAEEVGMSVRSAAGLMALGVVDEARRKVVGLATEGRGKRLVDIVVVAGARCLGDHTVSREMLMLAHLFARPDVTFAMHVTPGVLPSLLERYGCAPSDVFDTHAATKLLFGVGEDVSLPDAVRMCLDIDVAADAAVDHLPALASVLQRKLNEKMHTTWASWVPHTEQATPTAPSTASTTPADSTEAKSVGLMEEEIEALTVAVDEPAQEAVDVQGHPTAIETHAPQPTLSRASSPQEPPLRRMAAASNTSTHLPALSIPAFTRTSSLAEDFQMVSPIEDDLPGEEEDQDEDEEVCFSPDTVQNSVVQDVPRVQATPPPDVTPPPVPDVTPPPVDAPVHEEAHSTYVKDAAAFEEMVAAVGPVDMANPQVIGLGVKVARKLCLMSLQIAEMTFVVDAILLRADPKAPKMQPFFGRQDITFAVHGAAAQLEQIFRAYGTVPALIFDTEICAKFVHIREEEDPCTSNTSIQQVVSVFLDHQLHMGRYEIRNDAYRRRPLSGPYLRHAALAVRFLPKLVVKMREVLRERGRLAWVEEDSQQATAPYLRKPPTVPPRLSAEVLRILEDRALHNECIALIEPFVNDVAARLRIQPSVAVPPPFLRLTQHLLTTVFSGGRANSVPKEGWLATGWRAEHVYPEIVKKGCAVLCKRFAKGVPRVKGDEEERELDCPEPKRRRVGARR